MGLEEHEIRVDQLTPGMYVCRLDRPWEGAPFSLQGFLVHSGEQLTWLRENCHLVWIDLERGLGPADAKPRGRPAESPSTQAQKLLGSVRHVDTATFDEELPAARRAMDDAARLTSRILDDVRDGGKLSIAEVREAVVPVVQSVLRNADTMFWVNALQKLDGYAYSHAINCSALLAAFGRHLGLPAELLVGLASGGLLLDIGKTRLPESLLCHPGPLDREGMLRARSHVELGARILDGSQEYAAEAMEVVRTHHERWDGSGYPDQLMGTMIPLYGRMAAIIDSFDAMTSQRPHAPAMARHDALQQIYQQRDVLYQGELVEQFIGCLGVYPTGSLVELSTGEVAVVMTQNPARRLRPRVMVLTDAKKVLRDPFVSLDLMAQVEGLPLSKQINITKPLPIGAHGLDPAELYL
ncbi:HD-GYP domain-containing protein [Novilysobacter spongiicola]|uniref:HD-GYP domain, c-di-GMP phosphodiesterase class II (Or its inactivated variant) n=1 Tax=Lysobacter spongiicola DSM 21749 TaxID=1122188 RepID=A0A1T4RR28_9GAMM|nr:HD-GYP domain-containing protein [Lysobacter spongiicola]SKA18392.1 HD-GYP domain, c-di-GMP phosphodiesterase class II (or its inactivated variant) [Lysobacter spongiicola DSM 21749]